MNHPPSGPAIWPGRPARRIAALRQHPPEDALDYARSLYLAMSGI
ncbi:hypothetical protein ACFWBI_21840 [Streptomyces sp. NPDC059982]